MAAASINIVSNGIGTISKSILVNAIALVVNTDVMVDGKNHWIVVV
jgi:hypothetical protein